MITHNGAFYFRPNPKINDGMYRITLPNGSDETVSADAAGIAATLCALGHMTEVQAEANGNQRTNQVGPLSFFNDLYYYAGGRVECDAIKRLTWGNHAAGASA